MGLTMVQSVVRGSGEGEVRGEEINDQLDENKYRLRNASHGCGGGGVACEYRPTYIRDLYRNRSDTMSRGPLNLHPLSV